jgi:hypothetical protein
MSYLGQEQASTYRSEKSFTASSGQTTFSVNYTVGAVEVYRNGIKLQPTVDFTATDGATVVLSSGCATGDSVDIVTMNGFSLANVYSRAESDNQFVLRMEQKTKNAIINGNFDIWQRGTTFANPITGSYTADRWMIEFNGSGGTRTISRQQFLTVIDETGDYFFQWQQTANEVGNTFRFLTQKIENVRTFSGKYVTVSFYSNTPSTFSCAVDLVQFFGTGGSPSATVFVTPQSFTTTTAVTKFSLTFLVPSISGKTIGSNNDDYLSLRFSLPANTTFAYFNLFNVQLEEGQFASPFEYRTPQQELALCQRYFYRAQQPPLRGVVVTASVANRLAMPHPVPMRTVPTATMGGNLPIYDGAATTTVNAITAQHNTASTLEIDVSLSAGLTIGRPAIVYQAGTAYLDVSAEL